ncbi:CocE/NonD family hydrolase [Nocardia sp. NPDC051832]|uniref:CocE/NonD family hydrolase n=1 Tax=Nocardia sp. NPDC051832 TaxID=3155673 RepID=UPI00343B611F
MAPSGVSPLSQPRERTGLPPNARFGIGPRRYRRIHVDRGVAIRMSDGTILSADITRPAHRRGRPVTEPLPAIITLTPYNKTLLTRANPLIDLVGVAAPLVDRLVAPSASGRAGGREMLRALSGGTLDAVRASRTLIARGYVHVNVDVRGTGTSTGRMQIMSDREQQDALEVLSWVREQPWCDGDLGMTGISYLAISALQAAGKRPAGLKAVFALVGSEDPNKDLTLTGGVQSVFTPFWLLAVNGLKWLPSAPGLIRTGAAPRYLYDRITSPVTRLGSLFGVLLDAEHPEHFIQPDAESRRARIEDISAATWIHGGWHDVFDRSPTRLFGRLALSSGAKQVVVDDGFHINPGSGFGALDNPQRLDQLQCAFFDHWIKGIDNGIEDYGPVTVRQLGTGAWVSRQQFPHPDARVHRWYLSAEATGTASHAAADGTLGGEINARATRLALPRRRLPLPSQSGSLMLMGVTTLLGDSWTSDDRAAQGPAVVFTSAPMTADTLLSGAMNLHLRVVATGADAFWAVTVCDVAPSGAAAVLTRGALLSSRRALDEDISLYIDGELIAAEHPLTADSVCAVEPGVPHELDIDINATEAVLRAGHRLRVAVTRTSWPRHFLTPAVGRKIKEQSILLDPRHPSWLSFLAVDATAAESAAG